MTDIEEKTYNALRVLGINELREVDAKTLKQAYLKQAKLYHPDTCQNEKYKDGKMFNLVKQSYDFLNEDINRTNENINNILNPNNKTYNYNQEYAYNSNYNYQNNYNYYQQPNYKIIDKPSILTLIFCLFIPFIGFFMAILTRRTMPKASKWYLLTSIFGILLSFGLDILMYSA